MWAAAAACVGDDAHSVTCLAANDRRRRRLNVLMCCSRSRDASDLAGSGAKRAIRKHASAAVVIGLSTPRKLGRFPTKEFRLDGERRERSNSSACARYVLNVYVCSSSP
jgi:hypothetical protein